MSKIIVAEIKKIVSKAGIFILSVLLAGILVFGVFIYKPTITPTNQFELTGSTYLEKYATFIPNTANAGKKADVDKKIQESITSVTKYTVNSKSYKEHISGLIDVVNANYDNYANCAVNGAYASYIDNSRASLVSSLKNLNSAIEDAIISAQYGSYPLLISRQNYDKYKTNYKAVLDWAEVNIDKSNLSNHIAYYEDKLKDSFLKSISTFQYTTLSAEFIANYSISSNNSRLGIINKRLDKILNEIEDLKNLATINANNENYLLVNKMDELANAYVNTANTYINLVKYELICNAFSSLSTAEQLSTMYLNQHSHFNAKSLLTRYEYLFENDKTEMDFSKPLTIGLASNESTNGYDYAYFVLKIFSFVIIIYAMMACCHSISGEIKEGSMRYLAIRPVTRTQMFLGKWLAILIMSIILILFSAIIALVVGWGVYGLSANTILTIFNGEYAIALHPLAMLGIYLSSMILELIVYTALAMFVSSLFKSDLLGVTLLIILYLINILLPMFVQGSNTWLAFYPFSHLSLYALFGSSVYAVPGNFFNLIFGAKVYAGTHILLTISLILIITIALGAIAINIFKKKEL